MDLKQVINELRPQSRIDLILRVDLVRELIDVRSTVIYDFIEQKGLILAQTDPPTRRSMVGEEVEISWLTRHPDTRMPLRFGYKTKIFQIRTDYEFRPGEREQVLVVGFPKPSGLKETSVRLHYRVEPSSEHGFACQSDAFGGELHLVDISLGGMLISTTASVPYKAGEVIRIQLRAGGEDMSVQAEVIRVFNREGSRNNFVGLRFVELKMDDQHRLQDAINRVTRSELRARSGLEEPDLDPVPY